MMKTSVQLIINALLILLSFQLSSQRKIIGRRRPPLRPPIYPSEPLVCGPNESRTNCTNYCIATCDEPDREPCPTNYCEESCVCRPGFVRDENNTCVPIETCESYKCQFRTNEHWNHCGQECEPTCDNYRNPTPHCRGRSCGRGCFCDYGFVRDHDQSGRCVRPNQCVKKCGLNEMFSEFGIPCFRTASDPHPKCLDDAQPALCICETGFARNARTGVCEQRLEMDTRCAKNETYSRCDTRCGDECWNYKTRYQCPTFCERSFFCRQGYKRNGTQDCVLEEDCAENRAVVAVRVLG